MSVQLEDKTKLAWRKFLGSADGQAGLLFLRERIPGIDSSKADPHHIILQAGITEGFKKAIDTISDVITFVDQKNEDFEMPSRLSR